MSDFKEKLNNFFLLGDEEYSEPEEEKKNEKVREKNQRKKKENNIPKKEMQQFKKTKDEGGNIVAINHKQTMKKPRITIIEPRLYSEVHQLADSLLKNQSVIINFRRMDKEQAKKMLDFLMGVTYAIKGDVQRLGEEIFICTPQSVEVDGSELSEFVESLQ
ncbi:MAG: cell division protein SepF [Atopostipes suicloacalis]|nr:cell division protein SepF [Atopostipes suicloacalis]MDN6730950.1 cell division protein SepF [Atopostipes suicloacalis]